MPDVQLVSQKHEHLETAEYYYYYYLTAIGLTPGGSSAVHIYTQTVHRIQRAEPEIYRRFESTCCPPLQAGRMH
jgi:hypothetical protein